MSEHDTSADRYLVVLLADLIDALARLNEAKAAALKAEMDIEACVHAVQHSLATRKDEE